MWCGFCEGVEFFLDGRGELLLSVAVSFRAVIFLPACPEVRNSPERRKWGDQSGGPLFKETRYAIATT